VRKASKKRGSVARPTALLVVLLGALLVLLGACQRGPPAPPLPLTPTPAPSPTPSPTPLPTPTVAPPAVEVGRQVWEWARRLVDLSPRDTVSGGERKAAAFLREALEGMGYPVVVQPFPVSLVESRVSLVAPQEEVVENVPMFRSGEGEVEGEVVFIGWGRPEEIPPGGLGGKVALADRGFITFHEKARAAATAQALALLVANNQPGLFQGLLPERAPVPVVGISQEAGQRLKTLLAQGPVRLRVRVWVQDYPSQNIIAEKVGTAPLPQVVLVTAHYDTVPDVPGANDNASGVGAVLTLAQRLRDRAFPFTLRFILFGGEEEGLFGSRAYVQSLSPEERGRIRGVLNLDVVGSPALLATAGHEGLVREVAAAAEALGIRVHSLPLQEALSDHIPFLQAGIPALILTTPDYRLIHTPRDVMEVLDLGSLENAVRVVEEVLRRWGAGG